jgi:hypothetical protein
MDSPKNSNVFFDNALGGQRTRRYYVATKNEDQPL